MTDQPKERERHGNMAANAAVMAVAGGVTCTVWGLLRQVMARKSLAMGQGSALF